MGEPGRRLRAACDLQLPWVREGAGDHIYDGRVQDLSADGVAAALGRLGRRDGEDPEADAHDEAHLSAFEDGLRWYFGEFEGHRRDPQLHLHNLELACYDREYAPEGERDEARAAHVAAWPEAIDAAVGVLDRMPAPVARAALPAFRGLGAALDAERPPAGEQAVAAARAAHGRLVAHLEQVAETGDPDPAVGGAVLTRAMSCAEATDLDLTELAGRADAERDRLKDMLAEACRALEPTLPTGEAVVRLLRDHPDADGVLDEARALTDEVLEWTRSTGLAPWSDGECLVGPAPESRKWVMATMTWAGPEEADAPSWYHVTPPDPSWPEQDQEEWLAVFSRTSLPAITVHEVAPGHYSHGRALRRLTSPVRRRLQSTTFIEGWAHYAEEMAVEEGFRDGDPRYAAGVALEALVRVTRLAAAIGIHTGVMTVEDAAARFTVDAHLGGSAARSEADRGTWDITYGRYTWGKFALLDLREQARLRWGGEFSLPRLHGALMDLGAPPLGLIGEALERG